MTNTAPPITGSTNWSFLNAPNLLYFTNYGAMTIPAEAHFGDDRLKPYAAFVNGGTISADFINIRSSYFQNNGLLSSSGPLLMSGSIGKLENGQSGSSGITEIMAGSVKFNHYQLTSSDAVLFLVTNSLFDAGPGSGSLLTAPYGFSLLLYPKDSNRGDLLGTTLQCVAPRFYGVTHTWAAQDRGLTTAGYSNNTAVGTLVLGGGDAYSGHYFQGIGASNALYVDLLNLTGLADFQNQLSFNPNLVLYFAAADVSFTPPPDAYGVAQEPEEYLNGQFDGHLVWNYKYAGANSSVAVVSNGVSILVNRALRFSKIIDSNGDGIPNYYDPNPFSTPGPMLSVALVQTNQPAPQAIAVSWLAAPNTVYRIEYTTNMPFSSWRTLLTYTNTVATNRMVTVVDPSAPTGARRFYRVSHSP